MWDESDTIVTAAWKDVEETDDGEDEGEETGGGGAGGDPRDGRAERADDREPRAGNERAEETGSASYSDDPAVYLNFTSMHGVQPIIARIRELSEERVPEARVPSLRWFERAIEAASPLDIPPLELPFSAYLITGNAGSGKSTCVQTLSETMECVITGATRVAAQNIYAKLSAAYSGRHVATIFHEFGFRSNHVQAVLGRERYVCASTPPSVAELQLRDLVYYWDVLADISRRALQATASTPFLEDVQALERRLGLPAGHLSDAAFCANTSLPAFTRSNVIVIDEAGLLGRHILTAVVYSWWLLNCVHRSPQYAARAKPVIVCIGSPTQTDSLESTFEHQRLRCRVRASENILTYLITNRTLRAYTAVPRSWTIFINNKRCREFEFGELLKTLEYGLPITEEHLRLVDKFVVPDAYINDPENLRGWTRLYSSHREVSTYMAKLHAHLRVTSPREFVVFTLPVYTLVGMRTFTEYCELTDKRGLSLTTWLAANAGRIANYSQSRDHNTSGLQCEVYSKQDIVLARADVTLVLNSQVTVTARLKKLVFGFAGTFAAFARALDDDAFVKTQGEAAIEYAYRFLSTLLFGGMIEFYNFLRAPGLPQDRVTEAYALLREITASALAKEGGGSGDGGGSPKNGAGCFGVPGAPAAREDRGTSDDDDDDVVFSALSDESLDMLYCNYEFTRPETTPDVYAQFLLLKGLFADRYAACRRLFGDRFTTAPFHAYVEAVNFQGCEVRVNGFRGGLLATALQTDSYTLLGYTHAPVLPFAEEMNRRKLADGARELLGLLNVPRVVLRDQHGFVSVLSTNVNEFTECVADRDLDMATNVDYGLSSKLAMTIARSQGLSLEKVAVCFPRTSRTPLRLNCVYVAMSRAVSSRFLRMNLNPLRERYERDESIGTHILAALRDPEVHIVY